MNPDEPNTPSPKRGRPAKGAPSLTMPKIQQAALELVDAQGLAALTMRQLASVLGVDPMAIYRHLPGKEGLHDTLIEAVMAEFTLPEGFHELGLGEGLAVAARAYHRAVMNHPSTLPILMTRPFLTPGALMTIEGLLGFLAGHGISPVQATQIINVVSAYVLGTAASWASHYDRQRQASGPTIPWQALDVSQVPHLLNLAQTTGGQVDFEGTFDAGLRWLIAGIVREAPGSDSPDHSP